MSAAVDPIAARLQGTHLNHASRNSVMLRTVALLALVAGASAYQTDEIFCTNAYNFGICSELETETTCTANTKCLWNAGDDECGLNANDAAVIQTDTNSAITALTASTAASACYVITVEATCTLDTNCVWSAESGECLPTITTANAAMTAAGVPAGVQGLLNAGYITSQTTCGPATPSATTCTDSNCQFDVEDSECEITKAYFISTMSAKCGTNGAAARSAAQAALGISSGANSAAPAMVIISALVGALAIFA